MSKKKALFKYGLEEIHKKSRERIQIKWLMKTEFVLKLYACDKYNLAKTYKSCMIICNILRVEKQMVFKVY